MINDQSDYVPFQIEYSVKTWVDAQDQKGIWRIGRIKKKEKNILTVSFDGWSDKFNMTFCSHSNNIAPIRMYTKGYTGQQTIPLRDYKLPLSMLKPFESKISSFKRSSLRAFGAYETTIFLRADLFVLIDELMTRTYFDPAEELPYVLTFLNSFIGLYKMWLQNLPSLFDKKARIYSTSKSTKFLYLESTVVACFEAGYELSSNIGTIFSANKRSKLFYSLYGNMISRNSLLLELLDNGGIKSIIEILNFTSQETSEKISIDIIWLTICIITSLNIQEIDKQISSDLPRFAEVVVKRLLGLTAKEGANLATFKDENIYFMEHFPDFMKCKYKKEEIARIMELIPQRTPLRGIEFQYPSVLQLTSVLENNSNNNALPNIVNEDYNELKIKIEDLESQIEGCKKEIEIAQKNVAARKKDKKIDPKPIPTNIFIQDNIEYRKSDNMEKEILDGINCLLDENKIDLAIKLIEWRKNKLNHPEEIFPEKAEEKDNSKEQEKKQIISDSDDEDAPPKVIMLNQVETSNDGGSVKITNNKHFFIPQIKRCGDCSQRFSK